VTLGREALNVAALGERGYVDENARTVLSGRWLRRKEAECAKAR
jgi:hypothetical protein